MNKSLYDDFHRDPLLQKKVINEKNFTYRLLLKAINPYLKKLKKIKRYDILDIGCGVGTIDFFLAEQGFSVSGIDISRNAINKAKENALFLKIKKPIFFKSFDFLKEKIKKKFDFIICSEVIEHLQDDRAALMKIFSLTKTGGFLYISIPSKNAPLYRYNFSKGFDKKVGHLRRYGEKELTFLVEEVGFSVLEKGKTEGILRNSLFLIEPMNFVVKFLNKFGVFSDFVTKIDNFTVSLFGESNIFILAQKK